MMEPEAARKLADRHLQILAQRMQPLEESLKTMVASSRAYSPEEIAQLKRMIRAHEGMQTQFDALASGKSLPSYADRARKKV